MRAERAGIHGPLARVTVEAGLRFGHGSALVVSAGLRARKIATCTCDQSDGDASELDLGPALGVAYEWRL